MVESVYSAVRTGSLNKADFVFKRLIVQAKNGYWLPRVSIRKCGMRCVGALNREEGAVKVACCET